MKKVKKGIRLEEYSRREIPSEVREPFLALLKKYKSIGKEIDDLDSKRDELLTNLRTIKKSMDVLYKKEFYFDGDFSWKEKIVWVLENEDRLLPVSAIVSLIKKIDKNTGVTVTPIVRLTLERMIQKNEIIKYSSENLSSLHYGLPEWFINGELLEAYYF
ncbi:hypothetical protein [Winogradskyella sp.]|uniref:hypothetical protein n=1 Tax=Winogradskyella sp. TaxID=1883156 RepID=UPI002626A6E9|nr:hypothetical protein [Winogradskyella sp.]